ncbi:MAG: ATP-dependent DNA ligase [bacterium]
MKFIEVAQVFNEIEKESSRTKITRLLAELLKKVSPNEAAIISYMSLGELNPTYIGTQFNFAEKNMLKVLGKLLDLSESKIKSSATRAGDLGLIFEKENYKSRIKKELSIKDVEQELHEFEKISGTGAQEKKEKILLELLHNLDAISAKYVVRIIIGKLRLGFSDMTLLDAFSWMELGDKSLRKALEDAYNVSVDIGLIVKTLKEDGIKAIRHMKIIPGIPIRPAAAERLENSKAILKKIGKCIAQPKLDGFRLQVHVDKHTKIPKIHFYSRNLQDMSYMFPDLKKIVEKLSVKNLISEGEAIAFDEETGNFLPFQETVKRKRKYAIEEMAKEFPLKLFLFDVLFLNNKSYLDQPYHERRKELLNLFKSGTIKKQNILLPIDEEKIDTSEELEKYFNENITVGLEGIVAKRPDAVYQPGKRNFNWIKLKREEGGELSDSIDCVILGYYHGKGKRVSFGIGALLVGVYNKKDDNFETIAKMGTGLTDKQWKEQKKMCDEIKVANKPKNVECAKELYPDVWCEPKIVCEIRADEITQSPLHTAGLTKEGPGFALRFPRIMGYRQDKAAQDATTVKEIKELYKLQFEKEKKGKKKK